MCRIRQVFFRRVGPVKYWTDSRGSTGPEYAPVGSHIERAAGRWASAQNLAGQFAGILDS
jgi:hypothetical protein